MADAFVSYSHLDREFAHRLTTALKDRGSDAWVDLDIRGGRRWSQEIQDAMVDASSVVWIASPDSLVSAECAKELDFAVTLSKRLIPLCIGGITAADLSEAAADWQVLVYTDGGDFEGLVDALHDTIETDPDGDRQHARLSKRATDWLESGQNRSHLLRGSDLTEAELWLTRQATRRPAPSERQAEFILASRRAATRRQRGASVVAALTVIILLALTVFSIVQRNDSRRHATEAEARSLAAQAIALSGTSADTALLLGAEAYTLDPSIDSQTGLLTALNGAKWMVGYHRNLPHDILIATATPDHKQLVVLTSSGTLERYDTTTWQLVGSPLASNIKSPYDMSLSPDGKLVVYAAVDGAHILRLSTGARVGAAFGGRAPEDLSAEFSGNGRDLLLSSLGRPGLRIFSASTRREVASVGSASTVSYADAVSPTSDEFVAGPIFGSTIRRYRLSGKPVGARRSVRAVRGFTGGTYSSGGKQISIGGLQGGFEDLAAHSLRTLGPVGRVRGSRVTDTEFSPGGFLLAAGSDDGSVDIVAARSGDQFGTITGLEGNTHVIYLPNFRLLVLTSTDVVEYRYNLNDTQLGKTSRALGSVSNVQPESGGVLAIEGSHGQMLSTSLKKAGSGFTSPVRDTTEGEASPDGSTVALQGASRSGMTAVGLVDRRTGKTLHRVTVPGSDTGGVPGSLAFSPDGGRLAVGTASGRVSIIDVASGKVLVSGDHIDSYAIGALLWSHDGNTLYVGGQSGVLFFVDPGSGNVVYRLPLASRADLTRAVFVPGTTMLAVASESGFVYLVDTAARRDTGQPLSAGGVQMEGVAVSPDGQRVAALGRDGGIRLWDLATRKPIGPELSGHLGEAQAISFVTSDRLITGSFGGSLISWDLAPASWVARACALAGRNLTRAEWAQYVPDMSYRPTCPATG